MSNVNNWLLENCITIGNGSLELSGTNTGFARFRDAFSEETVVYYSILDGANREDGIGTFNGVNFITRDTIISTLFEGVFNDTDPVAIELGGAAVVACTFSAKAFNDIMTHINGGLDQHGPEFDDHVAGTFGNHPAADIVFPNEAETTFNNQFLFNNASWSSGIITGCAVTPSATTGAVDIAAGEAVFRQSQSSTGNLYAQLINAQTDFVLPDNASSFLYAEFVLEGEAPVIGSTESFAEMNGQNRLFLAFISRVGNSLNIVNYTDYSLDYATQNSRRLAQLGLTHVPGGSLIAEIASTLKFTVTAGVFYFVNKEITHALLDTSAGDTFTYWYESNPGVWASEPGKTDISATLYSTGAGLAPIPSTEYSGSWIYAVVNTTGITLHALYSTITDTDKSVLDDAGKPSAVPPILNNFTSILIGKAVVQEGATTFESLTVTFDAESLGNSVATTHNSLSGIQGGVAGDRQHLSTAEKAALAPLDSPTFINNPTAPTQTVGDNSTKLATTAFVLANGGTGKVISETPPVSPSDGQEWMDSTTGLTYTWYEDVDSGQWVQQASTTSPINITTYSFNTVTITSSETIITTNYVTFVDATSGNITATLPSASGNNGIVLNVKRVDNTINTVGVTSPDGIDDETTFLLAYNQNITVISDNTQWRII